MEVLDRCTEEDSDETWRELRHFSWLRLYQPDYSPGNNQSRTSLTSKLKSQLTAVSPTPDANMSAGAGKRRGNKKASDMEKLRWRVDTKLAEGDIRGAV